jgi:hypothetical protein
LRVTVKYQRGAAEYQRATANHGAAPVNIGGHGRMSASTSISARHGISAQHGISARYGSNIGEGDPNISDSRPKYQHGTD